ncbi:MAG: glycosyltransferase [Solobacterium sp.]|nr:glycosyltransferase [Solobacterium sp.]MBQ6533001.1 glycosyltransferase [Solobacterium sp.]
MTKLSLVIPCYYNGMNIPETYQVICRDVFSVRTDIDYELIFVDDGSGDDTLLQAKIVQNKDPRVKIVKLSRNFGEFRAIVAGLSQMSGDCAAVMSADLQDPPALIPELFASWEKGNLVNLAVRKDRQESALKNWFADTYYKLVRRWVEPNYPKRGFDFFLIDRKVADELVEMQEKNSSIYLQLIWLGYTPTTIEYVRREREKGKSMWSFRKRVNLFIDTFVVFSNKPIRFVTGCGLCISLAGLILAIFFIVDWFRNSIVPGWTSLIVVILLTSGFQMVMFGILGEYVWRNLDETRKRPLYVIEKVITAEPEEKHYENRGE